MADKKSEIQKDINKDLALVGGEAFTEREYQNDKNAITLLAMKNETYVSELIDPIDRISEYQRLLLTAAKQRPTNAMDSLPRLIIDAAHPSSSTDRQQAINQINALILKLGLQTDTVIEIIKECKAQPLPISEVFQTVLKEKLENAKDINATMIKKKTAEVLGLHNQPLIDQIADSAYLLTGMTYTCPECGHTIDSDDIQAKIDAWVLYCSRVDKAVLAMKEFPKTWNNMKKKQKAEYLKPLKSIALATNDPMLNVIIHFAENYGRHQGVRAQANALLAQQLPNITTFDIAKKVTNDTSLNKPQ